MTENSIYVISGFSGDGNIYRYGKKIFNYHKDKKNYQGKSFWELSGTDYTHARWFIAMRNGITINGTAMVSPLGNKYSLLSNFAYDDEKCATELIGKARAYSKEFNLVYYLKDGDKMFDCGAVLLKDKDMSKVGYKCYVFRSFNVIKH
jgi:hypothetical protein